jgi:hypothetical protein
MTEVMELTVTQKLRLFLARSGQQVAPWSGVEEVMDRLYGLLYERREQQGLWNDLVALLDSIQCETRGILAAPDAEILSRSRVDTLVAELRRAVRASAEAPAAGAMRRFALGKSASVLACIALLAAGFSLGCGSSSSNTDVGSVAETRPTPDTAPSGAKDAAAPDAAVSGANDAVVADASTSEPKDVATVDGPMSGAKDVAAVDGPTSGPKDVAAVDGPTGGPEDVAAGETGKAIDGAAGDALLSGDALMDLFRDGTPEDIAAKLETAVEAQPDRSVAVVYKGVTFPAEQSY